MSQRVRHFCLFLKGIRHMVKEYFCLSLSVNTIMSLSPHLHFFRVCVEERSHDRGTVLVLWIAMFIVCCRRTFVFIELRLQSSLKNCKASIHQGPKASTENGTKSDRWAIGISSLWIYLFLLLYQFHVM